MKLLRLERTVWGSIVLSFIAASGPVRSGRFAKKMAVRGECGDLRNSQDTLSTSCLSAICRLIDSPFKVLGRIRRVILTVFELRFGLFMSVNLDMRVAAVSVGHPMSPAPAFEPEIFADLGALERLIDSALDPDFEDDECLNAVDANRRRDLRRPFLAELFVVLITPPDDNGRTMRCVPGWTQNLSPVGVGFVVSERLPEGRHMMLIRHPDHPAPKLCFAASLIWEEQHGSQWEYGAVVRPFVSTAADLERFAS